MTALNNLNLTVAPTPIKTQATDVYLNVVKAADTRGFSGPNTAKDNEVSADELREYQTKLKSQATQINLVNQLFTRLFGESVGSMFKSVQDDLNAKLTATNTMLANYDRFANPDNATFVRAPGISEATIKKVAEKDGNAANISKQDVVNNTTPPASGTPNNIQELFMQLIKLMLEQFLK